MEGFALEGLLGVGNSQIGGLGLGVVGVILPLATGLSPAKQLIWRRNSDKLDRFGVVDTSKVAAYVRRRHGRTVGVIEFGGDGFASRLLKRTVTFRLGGVDQVLLVLFRRERWAWR